MKEELKKAIEAAAKNAAETTNAIETLQFTQAALLENPSLKVGNFLDIEPILQSNKNFYCKRYIITNITVI